MLVIAYNVARRTIPAFFRHCKWKACPAGTLVPNIPFARGTELPFGTLPEGAPLPPGMSPSAKAKYGLQGAQVDVPELASDSLTAELVRLVRVMGSGLDGLARSMAMRKTVQHHRDGKGELADKVLNLREVRAARSFATRLKQQLGSAWKFATVEAGVSAAASLLNLPVQLLTLNSAGELETRETARPAEPSISKPPASAPADLSAPVSTSSSALPTNASSVGNRTFNSVLTRSKPAADIASSRVVRRSDRRHSTAPSTTPSTSTKGSVFEFEGTEDPEV